MKYHRKRSWSVGEKHGNDAFRSEKSFDNSSKHHIQSRINMERWWIFIEWWYGTYPFDFILQPFNRACPLSSEITIRHQHIDSCTASTTHIIHPHALHYITLHHMQFYYQNLISSNQCLTYYFHINHNSLVLLTSIYLTTYYSTTSMISLLLFNLFSWK